MFSAHQIIFTYPELINNKPNKIGRIIETTLFSILFAYNIVFIFRNV